MKNRGFFILTLGAISSLIIFRSTIVERLRDFFKDNSKKVVIRTRLSPEISHDSIKLGYMLINEVGLPNRRGINLRSEEGRAKWISDFNGPYQIYTGKFIKNENQYWLAEPGDDVTFSYDGSILKINGNGVEKYVLQQRLKVIQDSLKNELSNPNPANTNSMEEYREWCSYLGKLYQQQIRLIDSYKSSLSDFAYNYIRDITLDGIVDERCTKFNGFLRYATTAGLSPERKCEIYDSTCSPFLVASMLPSMSRSFGGSWAPLRLQVSRKYSFDEDNQQINTELKRTLLIYELGLKTYQGLAREEFLTDFLTNEMITDLGFIPEVETALAKYYAEPSYPEYKRYVKDFEINNRVLKNRYPAPDFGLTDQNGKKFNMERLKNKVALLYFWSSGNNECMKIVPVLQAIENEFINEPNLVLVNISVDKDKLMWQQSIKERKYTTSRGINAYTSGKGTEDDILKRYNVTSYPDLYMIDGFGNIIHNPLPDPTADNGKKLITWIKEQLILLKDGPYVVRVQNKSIAWTINGLSVTQEALNMQNNPEIRVQSDKYNADFPVMLKKGISMEPSVFSQPAKLVALSDIEGNLTAFIKLLRSNNVIDDSYNWVFGNGHLVLTGNMMGGIREGRQVIECLWLIYSLEQKAKSAGGYVHFILGNKEILWLSGTESIYDLKYLQSATKAGKTIMELVNSRTELGKWLRTKNIMEKIGNMIFVNSGISEEVNRLGLTVSQVNELARPYYDRESIARTSANKSIATLFNYRERNSLFWYRNYYLDQPMKILVGGKKEVDTVYKTPVAVVDNSLKEYGVRHIVTGNSLVAYGNDVGDTVSLHYTGKVINIFSRHSIDKSEALLVEGNTLYRVNNSGHKIKIYSPE